MRDHVDKKVEFFLPIWIRIHDVQIRLRNTAYSSLAYSCLEYNKTRIYKYFYRDMGRYLPGPDPTLKKSRHHIRAIMRSVSGSIHPENGWGSLYFFIGFGSAALRSGFKLKCWCAITSTKTVQKQLNKLDPILYVHHFKRNVETERERKNREHIIKELSKIKGERKDRARRGKEK